MSTINLKEISVDTFCAIPEQKAKELVAENQHAKNKTKTTQIRRFYDEVVKWHEKTLTMSPDEFQKQLPYIHMIQAMVEYSVGRGNSNRLFADMIRECLSQVKDKDTFNNFKCFFEAFVGFFKAYSKD